MRIAIDGGAATGKSSISKEVARRLNLKYLNTGFLYRISTLFLLKECGFSSTNKNFEEIKKLEIFFDAGKLKANFSFSENELTDISISSYLSEVSSNKIVREYLLDFQNNFIKNDNVLLEGRDIGTVIMPNADFKFFLIVKPEEAAKRRIKQLEQEGNLDSSITYEDILEEIKSRNIKDSSREISPLVPSSDSNVIDTSNYAKEEIIEMIVNFVKGGYDEK